MTRRRLPVSRGQRAFTIVELVVVMLIMAIMAAVAAPKYRSALAHYRVTAAAGRVATDLRMIRQHARKTSTPQSVSFDATANTYAAGTVVIQSGSLQKTVQLDEAGHVRIL